MLGRTRLAGSRLRAARSSATQFRRRRKSSARFRLTFGNLQVQKVYRLIPLYLLLQLPIIVVMKIWFTIGAKESGPQSPQQASSVDAKVRVLHPGRVSAVRFSRPKRISREPFLQARWASGASLSLAPSASFQPALLTRKLLKIERFFAKWAPTSNRQWPTNRCYRKQRSKPLLTGTRTHISDFGFRALSLLPLAAKKRAAIHLSRQFNPPLASYVVGANLIPQRA